MKWSVGVEWNEPASRGQIRESVHRPEGHSLFLRFKVGEALHAISPGVVVLVVSYG